MDLNRYYRALLAARLQAVEGRRKLLLEGKIKGKEIDAADWAIITQMDEWAGED
jgi:hypothetical protein